MTAYTPAQLRELCERLNNAVAALRHSAQADGSIERSTAIWTCNEAEAAASAITFLLTRVEEAERRGIERAANLVAEIARIVAAQVILGDDTQRAVAEHITKALLSAAGGIRDLLPAPQKDPTDGR